MSKYDHEYFFITNPMDRQDLPSLTPDKNTENREFRFERQPVGSAPLVFLNGASDYQKKIGVRAVKSPPRILFDGSNIVVDDSIRSSLVGLEIPNMLLHPAIYIHDDGKWHEEYWYMTFTDTFNCWDMDRSTYYPEPMTLGGKESYGVYTYSLNTALLDRTPLESRLLFEMGGTTDGKVVCHQSIAGLFAGGRNAGADLVSVADFGRV